MPHMMDDFPLRMSTLYDQAVRLYPNSEVVSVESDGTVHRTDYVTVDGRVRRLAAALESELGVAYGGAIGTFAWNNRRHHELYWATANSGRICHTLNIRLFPEQLTHIVNHGEDQVIFVDPDLADLIAPVAESFESVRAFVILADSAEGVDLPNAVAYEDLISRARPMTAWPDIDERDPLMYCYTSGTTGNSKGVAYTHRSTYVHTISNLANLPIAASDNVLPVVPMFHAAAWGFTFMATVRGAKITLPGPDLSPEALVRLFQGEEVTISAGVPTVWIGVQEYLAKHPEADVSSIRSFVCGGSAVPRSMIDWYRQNRDITVIHAWGMTETNPLATLSLLKPHMLDWEWEDQLDVLETQGTPVPGLEIKIVDEEGDSLPHDGEAFGELLIRGPWVAAEYHNEPRTSESFRDGWLRTGDVCKVTPEGYVKITDRAKDVIKSGGEWISSLDLENSLMAHPDVLEATVVGVNHEKWQERPVAFVVMRPGAAIAESELIEYLRPRVAKWWLPDRVIFIDEIPKTGTGKFDKKAVREQYMDVLSE